jgi:hypothetical protein
MLEYRHNYGCSTRVFRSSDKPNDLILLAEYEEAARVRQLFQSAEFGEATQRVDEPADHVPTIWCDRGGSRARGDEGGVSTNRVANLLRGV